MKTSGISWNWVYAISLTDSVSFAAKQRGFGPFFVDVMNLPVMRTGQPQVGILRFTGLRGGVSLR